MLAGDDVVADADRRDVEVVPAPCRSAREHGDVAAVRVDVEVVGVEVADADVHDQYAFVSPRAVRMRCRPSIAVYVGRTTSSPPVGVSSSPRSSAAARSGCTSIASSFEPAVAEAQRKLRGATAARDERLEPGQQRLEVDVPDPRHVAPVGDLVVERGDEHALRAAVDERANRLVRAGRVLDQEQKDPLVADLDPLEPPERGGEAREPGGDLVERRTDGARECRCRERVVDVVEAREREARRAAHPQA